MKGTSPARLIVDGTVCSGLGRGAQFLQLDWVVRELGDKAGLNPFPGTLNVRIAPQDWAAVYKRRHRFVKIANPAGGDCPGFVRRVALRAKGRLYSAAYLILPERTMYKDVLEIIAAENLRRALDLKDGDPLHIEEFSAT